MALPAHKQRPETHVSLRGFFSYWASTVRWAWHRSISKPEEVAAFVVGGIVTTMLALWAVGDSITLPAIVKVGVIPLFGGGLAGFVTLFMSNIIAEPARHAKHQAATIATLKRVQDRQHIADTLTDMREDGIKRILNNGFICSDDTDFDRVRAEATAWLENVIDEMKRMGCTKQDMHDVKFLHTYPILTLRPERARINNEASQFSARLDRLKRVIDKYADD